jgi:hypothetical protein
MCNININKISEQQNFNTYLLTDFYAVCLEYKENLVAIALDPLSFLYQTCICYFCSVSVEGTFLLFTSKQIKATLLLSGNFKS